MDKAKKVDDVKKATTPLFQIVMIGISVMVLSTLLYRIAFRFYSSDAMPQLLSMIPAQLEEFGGRPKSVKVGLFIKNFPEFNMIENDFTFSGILWFEFDPSITSLDTLGKFTFEKGEILSVSEPTTRIIRGKIFARYDIRVRFKTSLDFSRFPLDDHTIYITLDNQVVSPGEVTFESSLADFIVSPYIQIFGWRLYDRLVRTGYSVAYLEESNPEKNVYHPRVVFGIEYERSGTRQIITILLPLILVFYISIFSFSMAPKVYYRSIISLSTGTVTALLAYRFVIENLSPKTGYFMLSDLLFFMLLAVVFLIFFVNTLTLVLSARVKQLLTIGIHLLVIISFIYFIGFWLK